MDFNSSEQKDRGLVLEITPLVDVVFLLLIFFLLTATFVRNPNIPINLPQASVQQASPTKRDVMVGITAEGELRYEGRPVSLDQLRAEMRHLFAREPEAMVLIQADRRARHGKVVQVMDLAKQVGFERLGIAIETASASPGEPPPPENE